MPKSDFASEEMARNKLAKDITRAYDKLVQAQPDIEGKPQILIEMLSLLGAFKELKLASDVQFEADSETMAKNLGVSIGSSPKLNPENNNGDNLPEQSNPDATSAKALTQKSELSRKETEQQCCQKTWKILSFGGREVTKDILVNLIHTLLALEEAQSIEIKLGLVKEATKIFDINEDLTADLKKMINCFMTLIREVKASRYLTHFARKLKTSENPREEKEAKECTFVPEINKRSREIDVTKKAARSRERGTSQEDRKEDDSKIEHEKKFDSRQRSHSPQRHEALYENYKEIQTKLQKRQEESIAQKDKEFTFKPKVSKAADKIKEGNDKRVSVSPYLNKS